MVYRKKGQICQIQQIFVHVVVVVFLQRQIIQKKWPDKLYKL